MSSHAISHAISHASPHAASTPPSPFYDPASAADSTSDTRPPTHALSPDDVLEPSARPSGFEKLPKISTLLVEQLIHEVVPRIEELTGLRVTHLPRVELVENSEMYTTAINDLLQGWSGSERDFAKVCRGAIDLLRPKRIWAHLPAVYFAHNDVLAVSIPALRGQNYDTMRLTVLGAMVASAACQTYPEYMASLDEARFAFLDALEKSGAKSDAAKQAKTSFLTRGSLVRAFAEHWRKFAQSHGYRFASHLSPGWVAKLAVVCSKEARANMATDANTGNLVKKHYESTSDADADFLHQLFKDPAALEALLVPPRVDGADAAAAGPDADVTATAGDPSVNATPQGAPQATRVPEAQHVPPNPAPDAQAPRADAPPRAAVGPVPKPAFKPAPVHVAPQPAHPPARPRATANAWVIVSKAD